MAHSAGNRHNSPTGHEATGAKRAPGSTFTKKVGGKKVLYRVSSSGKPFRSSNSKKAQQQRALNARLDAPIANIPGTPYASQTTERDLAHEAAAATKVKYGPQDVQLKQQLANAVQAKGDTNTYYQDYQNHLAQLQQQADAYNAGAMQALQNLPGMVTGLAQQQQQQVNQSQQQNSNPSIAGIGQATVAQNASNAAAIGQAAAGSYAAQGALVGNANQQHFANLVNNVAPAQRIQALDRAQGGINAAQQNITTQAGVEGAYNQEYRAGRRTDEMKNLLAQGALGINAQNANTAATKAAATAKNQSPEAKAQTTQDQNDARVAANHGYSLHKWRMLGPTKRSAIIKADKAKSKGSTADLKPYSSGPFAGKTPKWVREHPQQADALVKQNQDTKKTSTGTWVKPEVQTKAEGQAVRGKSTALQLKSGHEISVTVTDPTTKQPTKKVLNPNGTKATRTAAAEFMRKYYPNLDEAMLSAALDAAYNNPPHLSPYTVRKLIDAHYKPSSVARTLNIPTRSGMKTLKPTPAGSNTNYGGGAGAGSGTA